MSVKDLISFLTVSAPWYVHFDENFVSKIL